MHYRTVSPSPTATIISLHINNYLCKGLKKVKSCLSSFSLQEHQGRYGGNNPKNKTGKNEFCGVQSKDGEGKTGRQTLLFIINCMGACAHIERVCIY